MDGNPQQPDRLEDQLRRMIVGNASTQLDHNDSNRAPTVRLPPSTSYQQQQQSPGQTTYQQARQHHPHPNSNFYQQRNGAYPNAQHGPTQPGRPQNQGQQMHPIEHHRQAQNFQQYPRNFNQRPPPQFGNQRARFQQQMQLDPNAFQRGGPGQQHVRNGSGQQLLFNPSQQARPQVNYQAEQQMRQGQYLEQIATTEVQKVEMSQSEQNEKDAFRVTLERICHEVCEANPYRLPKVSLECFGSFRSGFATAGSDMDLVIVVKDQQPTSACFSLLGEDLPRELERRLLELGIGARLLTRTRVPIIKICEKPDGCLLDKLREEREKWDVLPNEKKYPHLHQDQEDDVDDEVEEATKSLDHGQPASIPTNAKNTTSDGSVGESGIVAGGKAPSINGTAEPQKSEAEKAIDPTTGRPQQPKRNDKTWTRERKAGPLDFPKTGVGIQSDINFFNPLGLHNTQMLRCYSLCDPRVRPMVIFVKAWAKRRKINSSYFGTLSSYGYVLMVLHYLVNVVRPPVLPNLQSEWRPQGDYTPFQAEVDTVDGWAVNFWRNEDEIVKAGQSGQLTANREPLGSLLAGFFHYYASQGGGITFRWTQEVLSLRSPGGILTKEDKGWTKATLLEVDGKRIQNRYLFCIEDPFELDHNVARTVSHNGIVAIRDEFRRAHRILLAVGNGVVSRDGELFAQVVEATDWVDAKEVLKANGTRDGPAVDGAGDKSVAEPPKPLATSNQQARTSNSTPNLKVRPHTQAPRGPPNKANGTQKSLDFHDAAAFPALSPGAKPSAASSPAPRKKAAQAQAQAVHDVTASGSKPKPAPTPQKKKVQAQAKQQKVNEVTQQVDPNEEYSEISGEQAKKILADVKRRKDEAAAEQTANSLAEAVLGGED